MGEATFSDFEDVVARESGVVSVERVPTATGVHVRLTNGWSVSVQCGPGNYCDNYDDVGLTDEWCDVLAAWAPEENKHRFSDKCFARTTTAEVAHFPSGGRLVEFSPEGVGGADLVKGHVSRDGVLAVVREVATYPTEGAHE